jgi:hypothetical protein
MAQKYKFKINNSYESPENINFTIFGLHKEEIITSSGFLNDIKYWKNFDGVTYSDLCVHEHRDFTIGSDGLAIMRTLYIEWFLTDDSVGYTSISTIKYYNKFQAIQEGIKRRNNIITKAKIYCIDTLGLNYSFDLMNSVKVYIDLFTAGYTQPLRDAITASTKPYLSSINKTDIVAILIYN